MQTGSWYKDPSSMETMSKLILECKIRAEARQILAIIVSSQSLHSSSVFRVAT